MPDGVSDSVRCVFLLSPDWGCTPVRRLYEKNMRSKTMTFENDIISDFIQTFRTGVQPQSGYRMLRTPGPAKEYLAEVLYINFLTGSTFRSPSFSFILTYYENYKKLGV